MSTSANNPMAWADHGACAGADPDIFHPVMTTSRGGLSSKYLMADDDQLAAARWYCDACPVRGACHDWAIHHEAHGIWAGTDPLARARLRRALQVELTERDPDEVTGLVPSVDEMSGGGPRQPSSPRPSA